MVWEASQYQLSLNWGHLLYDPYLKRKLDATSTDEDLVWKNFLSTWLVIIKCLLISNCAEWCTFWPNQANRLCPLETNPYDYAEDIDVWTMNREQSIKRQDKILTLYQGTGLFCCTKVDLAGKGRLPGRNGRQKWRMGRWWMLLCI